MCKFLCKFSFMFLLNLVFIECRICKMQKMGSTLHHTKHVNKNFIYIVWSISGLAPSFVFIFSGKLAISLGGFQLVKSLRLGPKPQVIRILWLISNFLSFQTVKTFWQNLHNQRALFLAYFLRIFSKHCFMFLPIC